MTEQKRLPGEQINTEWNRRLQENNVHRDIIIEVK